MKYLLSLIALFIMSCYNPADVAKEIKDNAPLTICYTTSEIDGSPGKVDIYTAHLSGIHIVKDETCTVPLCTVPLSECREIEITNGQLLIAYYKTGAKATIAAHKGQYWNL